MTLGPAIRTVSSSGAPNLDRSESDMSTAATVPSPADVAERATALAPELAAYLRRTPLVRFDAMSEQVGAEVLVKCENQQVTGSFKARGSLAKALTLTDGERAAGVVTASSGNHGLGVAHAMSALGGRAVVFVPEHASTAKVAAIRRFGGDVHSGGDDVGRLEAVARAYAIDHGLAYIPPYNDIDVVSGQGTLGVEMAQQATESGGDVLDAVVVSVGGGGLISGVASVLRARFPGVRVYGAQPAVDAAMAASVAAGRVVEIDAAATLSDGTAGGIEPDAITVPLCAELVDDWVLVDEPAIAAALRLVIDTEHQLIEGAAAVAVAATIARAAELAGQRVGVVACGANISAATLLSALSA